MFPNMSLETGQVARLRALSHPLRLRILGMVTARPVSATEVAEATGVAHAAASYHLRQLAAAGLIRFTEPSARTRAAGSGRPQQRYAMRSEAFRGLGPRSVRLLERRLLSELERKLAQSGTKHIADAEVWLTPSDSKRVRALTDAANWIVHSKALPPGTPRSKHVSLSTVLIEFST
jgi:predicted ArsR family transcriptional regulator